jgi:5S rRNA maturation endonuclease (ribonuclease M5)
MHGWLTGQKPPDAKVRGEDFKRVKATLLRESAKPDHKVQVERTAQPDDSPEPRRPHRNVPLIASDNEKVRQLVGMEELFISDPAEMRPACSAYWRRRRHFLTDDICDEWGVGVRPAGTGADKRGWSLRNHVVYRFLSEDNKELCYVGRDPEYDEKLRRFEAIDPDERDPQKRPVRHKFPAGFQRGLELYGQQSDRLKTHPEYRSFVADHGVIVVEGFNDVLALDHLGVPAVGICSNRITEQQAIKVIRWARQLGGGKVSLMFDCEATGDEGAKEALWLFAQIAPNLKVRLAWSQQMFDGEFKGRQPESLNVTDLHEIVLPALRMCGCGEN